MCFRIGGFLLGRMCVGVQKDNMPLLLTCRDPELWAATFHQKWASLGDNRKKGIVLYSLIPHENSCCKEERAGVQGR